MRLPCYTLNQMCMCLYMEGIPFQKVDFGQIHWKSGYVNVRSDFNWVPVTCSALSSMLTQRLSGSLWKCTQAVGSATMLSPRPCCLCPRAPSLSLCVRQLRLTNLYIHALPFKEMFKKIKNKSPWHKTICRSTGSSFKCCYEINYIPK